MMELSPSFKVTIIYRCVATLKCYCYSVECRIFSRSDSHFTFLLHTRQHDNIICLDLQQAITYSRLFEEILKFVHFSKLMNMHFTSRSIFESKFPIICSKELQKDVSLDIS